MDLTHSLRGVSEPPEVGALRQQSLEVLRLLVGHAAKGRAGLRPLVGLAELGAELVRIQPTAQRSAHVMQPQYGYDPEDLGVPMTRKARERGVETQLVTRPATVQTHPLLSSIFPNTLLGPCFLRFLVVDELHVIVGGPDDADGNRTSWVTDLPELVDAVNDLWRATLPLCRPILPEGEPRPLTERQLELARLLCIGEKDEAIARRLAISRRTVEREVAAVLALLEARSRTEAVLMMRGRGVNGGVRHPSGARPSSSPGSASSGRDRE